MGKELIQYGFERLGIGRIIQGVIVQNVNSISLMERLGFRIEKGLNQECVVGILDDYESWKRSFRKIPT